MFYQTLNLSPQARLIYCFINPGYNAVLFAFEIPAYPLKGDNGFSDARVGEKKAKFVRELGVKILAHAYTLSKNKDVRIIKWQA